MFSEFLNSLKPAWDYKFRNTKNNINEPYPTYEKPSIIYKRLNPQPDPKKREYLYHADTLFSHNKLGKQKPYKVVINYNNPKPYTVTVYADSEKKANSLAIPKFVNFMRSRNSKYSNYALINEMIKNGYINISVSEI